eukprot:Gb_25729 [translate_table: standard]
MSAGTGMQIPAMAPGASSLTLALPHSNMPNPSGTAPVFPYPFPAELPGGLSRIKLVDILPDDGAPTTVYAKAVECLSNSLSRNNAAIIELSVEDSALLRCAMESAKLYFRTRAQSGAVTSAWAGPNYSKYVGYISAPSRDMYLYRAGRTLEEGESSPPCMADVFRCLGKASRAALSAIARHLRLRSDVFYPLLDDLPLSANEVSSSVLVATYFHSSVGNGKGLHGASKPSIIHDMEKGLLTLIASDSTGLQVCDPNGRWYLADRELRPGDLILLTGRALSHITAGLCHAASHRWIPNLAPGPGLSGRTSMAFKLMPRGNAVLDCTPISDAGHVIPQGYGPISARQFLNGLTAEGAGMGNCAENALEIRSIQNLEPSLRSVLSDPLSGGFLEDAMVAQCGHSFGGAALRKVCETSMCTLCGTEVDVASMIPNFALRAAAATVKREENRRMLQNAAIRKRRKEAGEQRLIMDNAGLLTDKDGSRQLKGVQYPFAVDERVMIKGNKRTPDKFVGREAVVTSQCLNGWYLLRTLDNGESVRLQYRSLQKIMPQHNGVTEDSVRSQHSSQVNS